MRAYQLCVLANGMPLYGANVLCDEDDLPAIVRELTIEEICAVPFIYSLVAAHQAMHPAARITVEAGVWDSRTVN
jgi:hypothetical protein